MTRGMRLGRTLVVAGAAVAGLLAAHALDYLMVIRDAAGREELLRETGHEYLAVAAALAVAACLISIAATIALGAASRRGAEPVSFGGLAVRLVVLQVDGFVALEIAERLIEGEGFAHRFGVILAVGVLLQVVVACAAALILSILGWTVRALVGAAKRPHHQRDGASSRIGFSLLLPYARIFSHARPSRGPPGVLFVCAFRPM